MRIIEAIAKAYAAKLNCEKSGNSEWEEIWADRINTICRERLPSGSGVDGGVSFDWDASRPERLVFLLGFHHMDGNGMYDGWTDHSAIVTPSFVTGFDIRLTGRNRNDIKSYLAELLGHAFDEQIEPYRDSKKEEPIAVS